MGEDSQHGEGGDPGVDRAYEPEQAFRTGAVHDEGGDDRSDDGPHSGDIGYDAAHPHCGTGGDAVVDVAERQRVHREGHTPYQEGDDQRPPA